MHVSSSQSKHLRMRETYFDSDMCASLCSGARTHYRPLAVLKSCRAPLHSNMLFTAATNLMLCTGMTISSWEAVNHCQSEACKARFAAGLHACNSALRTCDDTSGKLCPLEGEGQGPLPAMRDVCGLGSGGCTLMSILGP